MAARWAVLALLVAAATGCDSLRDQIARGRRTPAGRTPTKLDPQFARVEPIAAPLPPQPPPLPTDPPVPAPKSEQFVGVVPSLPADKSAVPPPETPIVQTGAIALPESDGDDRKPPRGRPAPPRQPPVRPSAEPTPPVAGAGDDCLVVKKLLDAATKRYADLADFEARLIKREVVGGKRLPQDEIVYRFRKSPLSVFMKVLSPEGQGREVMYVQGQFDNREARRLRRARGRWASLARKHDS